jgi:hypothetical protein
MLGIWGITLQEVALISYENTIATRFYGAFWAYDGGCRSLS